MKTMAEGNLEELLKQDIDIRKIPKTVEELLINIVTYGCFGRYDGDDYHEDVNWCSKHCEAGDKICLLCKKLKPKFNRAFKKLPVIEGDLE